MAFQDIAGNGRVKRILELALARDRVPNSLLFAGPDGVGKGRTALTLAKALNCLERTDDSCDRCSSCLAIDGGRFPDVMEVETAEDKKGVAIEQIRTLKMMAYLRPMAGRKRVFIVSAADKMSGDAANSVLKVLEEPPLFSHIILVTAKPHLLAPTIRSRCQTLAFAPVTDEEIERILLDKFAAAAVAHGATPTVEDAVLAASRARIITLLVEGNLDRALGLEWEEVQSLKDEAWATFDALFSGQRGSLFLDRFGTLQKPVLEDFKQTVELYASFARDILLVKLGGDPSFLLNPDFEPRLRDAAARTSAGRLLTILAEIEFVLKEIGGNLNKNLLAASFFSNFGEMRNV